MAPQSEAAVSAAALPDPLTPRVAYVRGRRRESGGVWTLDIRDDVPAQSSQPGQFNMLTVFGVGEIPVSLSGDPAQADRLLHTVRPIGAVSRALAELRVGQVVGVRGPFGAGWPIAQAAARDILVVAGGLGLAPLRPALYLLRAQRKRYGRIVLLYGARSPEDILFKRELERWARHSRFEVQITVDHAAGSWSGNVGVVTALVSRAGCDPARTIAFVCGPEVMMRLAIAALAGAGVPDEAIYLSMERNMKCAVGLCGRCQFSRVLVCRDGPVFRYDRVRDLLRHREL